MLGYSGRERLDKRPRQADMRFASLLMREDGRAAEEGTFGEFGFFLLGSLKGSADTKGCTAVTIISTTLMRQEMLGERGGEEPDQIRDRRSPS